MKHVRWAEWNLDHTSEHGVTVEEIEWLILNPSPPYPTPLGDEKSLVWGRGQGGRLLQVIFVVDSDGETAFPIHARPLTEIEKRRFRRRMR